MAGIAKEIHYFPGSLEIFPYFWWILNPRSEKVLLLLVELRCHSLQKPLVISPLISKSLWHNPPHCLQTLRLSPCFSHYISLAISRMADGLSSVDPPGVGVYCSWPLAFACQVILLWSCLPMGSHLSLDSCTSLLKVEIDFAHNPYGSA